MKILQRFVDPPSGWQYGFPKELPFIWWSEKDLRPWLISCGYPPEIIKALGDSFYVRVWEEEVEE